MYRLILTVLMFAFTVCGLAQMNVSPELEKNIRTLEEAIARRSPEKLQAVNNTLSGMFASDSSQRYTLYYLAYSEYKLLEMSLGNDSTGFFKRFYTKAESHAALSATYSETSSEGKTLLAAIYMMKIARDWSEAMNLTKPFYTLLAEAEMLNAHNPRIFYIKGLMKLKTPEMFGGSRDEAIKLFIQANALFDKEQQEAKSPIVWGYTECLTWTAQAYAEAGNLETAKFFYTKVLQINPEYGWVKYKLLPELEKKMVKE